MKKISIMAFFFGALSLSACCKERSCTCKNNNNETVEVHTEKTKKKKAQSWCNDWDTHYKQLNKGACQLD